MRTQRRRHFKHRNNHLADLSMTPLIDVALTLLIMFMVTTPIIHNAIKVTLPKGNVQESVQDKNNDIIVYIDHQGDHYLNNTKTDRAQLLETIKTSAAHATEKKVYVKADTMVAYGTVLELVDDIKFIGGIKYVALATQKSNTA